jgi:hypothetical protein
MRPLLWKEMRDLRAWVLGAGALLLVLWLLSLCVSEQYAELVLRWYLESLMPLLGLVAAVGVGASQMARERESKTVDFLLARPVAPAAIVWTKFLAGSVALAMLLAAMACLAYVDTGSRHPDILESLRQVVGFPALFAAMFPRFWCLYAMALLLSTLVNRMAKAVVSSFAFVLALGMLTGSYAELFPYSSVDAWFGGQFQVAYLLLRDPALFFQTGFTLCGVALLLALAAALLFRRSPGWSVSNRWLILGAVGLAGLAILSTYAAAHRFPELRPVGSMELRMESSHTAGDMDATGSLVAVASKDRLAFLDFTNPAKPRKLVEAPMPLGTIWTTANLTVSGTTAYILGLRKALPTDELQIAIATLTPAGTVQFAEPISLGDSTSTLVDSVAVAGQFLYVDVDRLGQCQVEVYNLSPGASRHEAVTVVIDMGRWQPPAPGPWTPTATMRMLRRGQFLYVTSAAALTVLDIRDPVRPVAVRRIAYREPVPQLYGSPRALASDGRWLLEAQNLPAIWAVYDVADPAHPVLRGHVPVLRGGIVSAGSSLFQWWQRGALELRAVDGGLQALRYLTDGRDALAIAPADGTVYVLESAVDRRTRRQFVSAYRVSR